jgi:hypothetical protein
MTFEGRLRHTMMIRDGWRDSSVFSILAEEWQARRDSCPVPGIRGLCASFRWMPRKADEEGIPGRMPTEENAARRRMDGAHVWRIPDAGH